MTNNQTVLQTEPQLSNDELKNVVRQNYEKQVAKEANFPCETISLPSQGKVYATDSPLSNGFIDLKYPTAREEDILSSQNLIKNGTVLDEFLKSIIMSNVHYKDIVWGDKNAILVAARILAYGEKYKLSITCPKCETRHIVDINLNELPTHNLGTELKQVDINEFEYTLPYSKRTITFKYLNGYDDDMIKKELSITANKNRNWTIRLRHIIKSVDGEYNQQYINSFIDNELFSKDSVELRKYVDENAPNMDYTINFTCPNCNHTEEGMEFMPNVDFFYPTIKL